MQRIHQRVKNLILNFIDFFYRPFHKTMTLQMFRYAACGGFNAFLNILLYYVCYNYVLENRTLQFGNLMVSRHIAAYLITFILSFPIGFYLSMYVVFQGSYLRRRTQLVRYFIVTIVCIFINYVLLRLFVEKFGWNPTWSIVVAICFVVFVSYLSQKYFSFRTNNKFTQG